MGLTEVGLHAHPPERFRAVIGDRYEQFDAAVARAQTELRGRVIWHINSTARGGGVAEMLRSYLSYIRGIGLDVRWMVVEGNPEFFAVTKRLHNQLHGHRGDGGPLGEAERRIYRSGLKGASEQLSQLLRPGDIVFLHDPQTAGMAHAAHTMGAWVVWRCHVGVDEPNEVVLSAWDFLRPELTDADALVFSRQRFVWEGFEGRRIWIMPPTIDAFSPKNQEMDEAIVHSILETLGLGPDRSHTPPVYECSDGSPARVDLKASIVQEQRLPPDAPTVAQVSRWDRLKDPLGLLRCFAVHVKSATAHLALAGPDVEAVSDDPEGAEVLREVRAALAGLPESVRARVHLISLPMNDLDENAAMVNALQRRAQVVVQKSVAEGFGLTVAEAMWKRKPVVGGRVGGIQDQIVDGESGILVDPRDLPAVGAAIDGLLADVERAGRIGNAARERVIEDFLEVGRLIAYFEALEALLGLERARAEVSG